MVKKLLLIVSILLLSACGQDEGPEYKGDKSSPEYTISLYFHAIFETQDLKEAMSHSTDSHARVMKSYGSTRQFARNVLNMSFDSVIAEVDQGSRSVRVRYDDQAVLSVVFSGTYNGQKVNDLRRVKVIEVKGKWLVDDVLEDPYAR